MDTTKLQNYSEYEVTIITPGLAHSVSTASDGTLITNYSDIRAVASRKPFTRSLLGAKSHPGYRVNGVDEDSNFHCSPSLNIEPITVIEEGMGFAMASQNPAERSEFYDTHDLAFMGAGFYGDEDCSCLKERKSVVSGRRSRQYLPAWNRYIPVCTCVTNKSIVPTAYYAKNALSPGAPVESLVMEDLQDHTVGGFSIESDMISNETSEVLELWCPAKRRSVPGNSLDNDTNEVFERLAQEVLRFWPQGAIYYARSPTGESESSDRAGNAASPSSSSEECSSVSKPTLSTSLFGNCKRSAGGEDQEEKPTRGHKQDAVAGRSRTEWRCVIEACMGDDDRSCKWNHFKDYYKMIQHIQQRHTVDAKYAEVDKYIAHLKTTQNLATVQGRELFSASLFKMLCPDREVPYMRFLLHSDKSRIPYSPPSIAFWSLTAGISCVKQQVPVADAMASTVSSESHLDSIPGLPTKNPIITNLAQDFRNDALFSLEASWIGQKVKYFDARTEAALEDLKWRTKSKREELDCDPAFQGFENQHAKKQRLSAITSEQVNEMSRLQSACLNHYKQAGLATQKLYERHRARRSLSQSSTATCQSTSKSMSDATSSETLATEPLSSDETTK